MDYWYTQHGWISKKIILREETCPKELSTLMIPYIWHSRVNQTILSIEGKRLPYWIPLGRWGHRLTGMWRETFWSNVYILYHDTGLDSTGMWYNLLLAFDLLHLVGLSLGPSMLLQMTLFHSFSWIVEHIWWSTPHILWFLKTNVLEGWASFGLEVLWQLTCSASLIPGSQAGHPQIFNVISLYLLTVYLLKLLHSLSFQYVTKPKT